MLDNRFILYEIETRRTIKAFQISVLVEMLYCASDIIELAHHVVMMRTDEKLGSALELPLGLPSGGQDEAIDAAAVLVKPIKNISNRARFFVDT
jgi:hypothetical protein